jgi:hypothetical protein
MNTTPRRLPMVGWYDPRQLVRSGVEVLISTIFGRHSDRRLIEALASRQVQEPFFGYVLDASGVERDELWIDYVADTGDGWDPTFAVAAASARDLPLVDSAGKTQATRRGQVLVFGGDTVYPTASREEYEQRLIAPYRLAMEQSGPPHPDVFAIPGNHDWYDSLVAFTRLFCSQRRFGPAHTRQERSYFALRLPHGWWLLGTDMQLGSDLDHPQIEFFTDVARHMQPEDRVILCNAEPHWIFARLYGKDDRTYNESNLKQLEDEILPGRARVLVHLAGDLHHYRRHATAQGHQKITAGGGGAFLHPTHRPAVPDLEGGYRLQKSFPPERTSARLCWRNLLFPGYNPWFVPLGGALYMLTAWTLLVDLSDHGLEQIGLAVQDVLRQMLLEPVALLWVVGLLLGIVAFTDTHSRVYRIVAGLLHGFTHLTAIFLVAWWATILTVPRWPFSSFPQLFGAAGLIFLAGCLVCPLILGLYLLISLNVFGRHQNEAFSSLSIQDWKHFLRLRISREGLTIYPIGIRKVRRSGSSEPELIEDPIAVR